MKYKNSITERVRKDPDEEKARLQSRLSRAKTLGQQTRVADALSAARAAAGEKKPSDKRSWGASTGTAERLKKATVKEEQTAQLSPEQRAAAMKDRNSRIHRTPTELKAHDAGMKAYVKSQNNMTDSKGKKLDPYDDYQS